MNQDNITKAVCYANYYDRQQSVDSKHMAVFAERITPFPNLSVERAFVDCTGKKLTRNRPAWNEMLLECETEDIRLIIVPSISMLTPSADDSLNLIRDVNRKYGIDFYFICEKIFTRNESSLMELSFHCTCSQYFEQQLQQKKYMRKVLKEVLEEV